MVENSNADDELKILKSKIEEKVSSCGNPNELLPQIKVDIIEYYDRMICDIDIHTEKLLASLPEALKNGREELLQRVEKEREKCLAALADESPLIQHKNAYYNEFLELKTEYQNLQSDDPNLVSRREELSAKLAELKEKLQVLEEFLDDFNKRTLCFKEIDKSVYDSLIGELVLSSENQVDIRLN